MRFALVCLLALTAPTAQAVPLELTHQGRLMDALGVPLDGALDVTYSLYDTPTGGTALWTDTTSTPFDNGYFGTVLTGLSAADFDGGKLYLGIAVDGGAELPTRQEIVSVPYAIRAGEADHATTADNAANADTAVSVSGGIVDATEIRVNGTTVIDGTGGLANPHTHNAAEVDTGVLDIARLPIGTGATEVASGDHIHNFPNITGVAAVTQLPVGTGSTNVAAGDHVHTAADVGAVPDTGGTLTGSLVVTEEIQVGQGSATCTGATEGTLRFTGTELQLCTSSGWGTVYPPLSDGSTQAQAGLSCDALHSQLPSLGDGAYWIDPDGGSTGNAFLVNCDMNTDGGGWVELSISNAGADQVFRTNPDNSNTGTSRTGDQAQYYNQIGSVDGFTETEFLHNAASVFPNTTTITITYLNPATGSDFSAAELALLRAQVTELAPSTLSVAAAVDDSGQPDGLGHEIYLTDDGGTELLMTWGSQPGDEQSAYYLYHTTTALTSNVNTCCATPVTVLPAGYIIPTDIRLGWDSVTNAQWGGGAYWGYSEAVFLVK